MPCDRNWSACGRPSPRISSDGDTVFVGGFGQCVPFAIAHEIVRQRRSNLTLCRSGADILFDLLIAAGCVSKVIVGYVGNPGIGLAHAFRRAVESGEIAVEDWTNFAMVLRLHAGALGVPFLPTATLLPGDLAGQVDVRNRHLPVHRRGAGGGAGAAAGCRDHARALRR